MRSPIWTTLASGLILAALTVPGWAAANNVGTNPNTTIYSPYTGLPESAARPVIGANQPTNSAVNPEIGALNYVEGQVAVDGQAVSPSSVGHTVLQRGQSLTTQTGRAEILLTPGVFLRVGDNSSVLMVSPSLAPTEVSLLRGRAIVAVTYIQKDNDIRINEGTSSTQLRKKGIYEFDAGTGQIRVFKGEARVYAEDKKIDIDEGREVSLETGGEPKASGFKTAEYKDDLYRWSQLRNTYIQQANADYAARNGYGVYGPAWYWDPWFDAWAFPYAGWGWGWGWGAGVPYPYYGGYGYGLYGRPFLYGHPYRPGGFAHPGGFGGFHGGGVGGFHGGGFRGFGGRR